MGGMNRARDRGDHPGRVPRGHASAGCEALSERSRRAELQCEEGEPVVDADRVDLHDVRMVELGDDQRLGSEARELVAAGMFALQNHLQGDDAVETVLPGFIDDAHAAAAELALNFVTRHVYTTRRRGCRVGGRCAGGRQRGVGLRFMHGGRGTQLNRRGVNRGDW